MIFVLNSFYSLLVLVIFLSTVLILFSISDLGNIYYYNFVISLKMSLFYTNNLPPIVALDLKVVFPALTYTLLSVSFPERVLPDIIKFEVSDLI